MSAVLRWLLIAASILVAAWILYKIRKLKVKLEDAIFWVVFSVILLVLAIFPQISYKLSNILGIKSPANLIFLIMICILIEKIFTLSVLTSQLEEKVAVLSAELAIRSQAQQEKIDCLEKAVEEKEDAE